MSEEEILKYLKTMEQELQEENIQVIMNKNNAKYYTETLNLIEKQNKIIDLMAEFIGWNKPIHETMEEIKEYFYKEVEEENE